MNTGKRKTDGVSLVAEMVDGSSRWLMVDGC